MNFLYYNPQDLLYKSPFGAVEEDKNIRFRLRLPKDCGVTEAFLIINKDGGEEEYIQLSFEWKDGESLYYSCTVSKPCGLYFYKFMYKTQSCETCIYKNESELWQLTVYGKNFTTPESFCGGLIYQIFPDRFYFSGKTKENIPKSRYLRDDWGSTPCYLQNGGKQELGNDYFMGDLTGITQKLDYIKSLGVTVIYLNPIFFASSNHRYNTADYLKTDPVLGTEQDFENLCKQAHKKGIKIILDGVFSHTGDDSIYFNKYGNFNSVGAYQSENSPYYSWYKFSNYPERYSSWWGVDTLPEVNEENPDYIEFICGKNGVLRHWLRLGADGYRLDVADELPDVFLDSLRKAVKQENPNAIIIGEVWEDASNKISYSSRRRYFLGKQLDSVMNYPFCNAIINFVNFGGGENFKNTVMSICENYPQKCLNLLMNHIGTHDTARIINVLGYKKEWGDRNFQAEITLSEEEYNAGVTKLHLAAVLQYTLPGIPSLYYGDEAGLTGFADPFCRGCYPWDNQNKKLIDFYIQLGNMRKFSVFKDGNIVFKQADKNVVAYFRNNNNESIFVVVNASNSVQELYIEGLCGYTAVIGEKTQNNKAVLPPLGYTVAYKKF